MTEPTCNCVLVGHGYTNEMQVIAQIFFPNSRFSFPEIIPSEGYAVVGIIDGSEYKGELFIDGSRIISRRLELNESTGIVKRDLMLALFHALKEATGKQTPWGALTGVRPAKQVRIWFSEGDSETEIIRRLSEIYRLRDDKIRLAIEVAKAEERIASEHDSMIGLYVGVPFCPSRCKYCSFITAQKSSPNSDYLDALENELKGFDKSISANTINAVYVGGGTPTSFGEKDFARLLKITAPFTVKAEYTVEAGRPDSIPTEKLRLMKSYGVSRIAINPQTLNNATLKRIGREHSAEDFYKTYEMAQQLGFNNINADIIAGLPGESLQDFCNTVDSLAKLKLPHITVHTLAIKRASYLNEYFNEKANLMTEPNTVDKMISYAENTCRNLGLLPYYMYRQKNMLGLFENVGYSLPGYESLYNVAMMAETQTVLAAGAGAVSKLIDGELITRNFNPKNVETYINKYKKNATNSL